MGNHAALGGQADESGMLNQASGPARAGGSGIGNLGRTMLDTNGSGTVNGARDTANVNASGKASTAATSGPASGSGASGKALGSVSIGAGNSLAPGAGTLAGNGAAIKVAPNGLSLLNPDANGSYVFETRPQFANHGNWISSDYLLNALNVDPATTQKRLGDGFYEQRLVRDQLIELTGRAPAGGQSDDSRYKELLTSGISFAEQYNLRPGIALSADQISHLTSDIVWMETQTVVLPDGTVETVLAPKVYLAHADGDAVKASGALVTGAGVSIDTTESIVNRGGLIDGGSGRTMLVAGQDIVNHGGAIAGGDVGLEAKRNVVNQSLTVKQEYASVNTSGSYTSLSNQASISGSGALVIKARGDVIDTGGTIAGASVGIQAGRDISFNALQTGSTYASQVAGYAEKNSSTTYKVGQISSGGDLEMIAGQDMKLSGTQVSAGAAGTGTGTGTLAAGRDISIAAVVNEVKTSKQNDPGSKFYDKQVHENQTVVGATVAAGGNLTIGAGNFGQGSLTIAGSTVAGGGLVDLSAAGDVAITQVQEAHLSDTASKRSSSSVFRSTTTSKADYSATSMSVGSSVSGEAISITSGNNITVKGSAVAGEGEVILAAKNDVKIVAATSTSTEKHLNKVVESGFLSGGGFGISYGTRTTTAEQERDATIQSGQSRSIVGSIGGNLTVIAGNALAVSGSDVYAGKDMDLAGKSVTIDPGRDDSTGKLTTKMTQDGLTLAIGGSVVNAIQAVQGMSAAAGQTSNSRVQALAAATAAMAAKNAAQDMAANGVNVNISLTAGHSETEQTQTTANRYQSGSSLSAGNDLRITATGGGDASNINILGSDLSAKNNVVLVADNEVNVLAAQDTESQHSQSKSLSAAAGIAASIGTNGMAFGITGSVSAGRSKEDGEGVTQVNSHVNAGQVLAMSSGGDTNIKGAVVGGKQVVAEVGKNLNIASLQDTAKFDSKSQSISVSGTVGFGASVSGSVSQSRIHNDYASVQEQSGIQAGDGGFQVTVKGNTDLTGAVISSTAAGIAANALNTGTLKVSDISNHSVMKASSLGVSGGATSAGTGDASGPSDTNLLNMGKSGAAVGVPAVAALSDNTSSTTKSGISAGSVVITNAASQQAVNVQSAAQTIAALNRDVTTGVDTSGKIGNDFDKNAVGATMSVVSAFGAAAANEVGNYAATQLGKAEALMAQAGEEPDPAKQAALVAQAAAIEASWKEGGEARVALHAIVGGLTGGLSGAAGAAATAEVVPELAKKIAELDVPDAVKQALVLSAGAAIGGSVGGAAGAASGVTEVENNFLKHDQATAMRKEFEQCDNKAGGCTDADYVTLRNKYLELSRRNIAQVQSCINSGNVACVRDLESQAASSGEISRALVNADFTVFAGAQNNVLTYGSVKGANSMFGTDIQQAEDIAKFRGSYCSGISASGCDDLVKQAIADRMYRVGVLTLAGAAVPLAVSKARTLQLPKKSGTASTGPNLGTPDNLLPEADVIGRSTNKPVATADTTSRVEGMPDQRIATNRENTAEISGPYSLLSAKPEIVGPYSLLSAKPEIVGPYSLLSAKPEVVGPYSLLNAKPEIVGPYTPLSARSEILGVRQLINDGRINADELLSFVPGNTIDSFSSSGSIPDGFKFKYEVNGTKMEVKWHSPDAVANSKFPGSNSGTGWTAQIKIGNKLIGSDGYLYSKPSNITHIPLDIK